jgi:hypothetical protein
MGRGIRPARARAFKELLHVPMARLRRLALSSPGMRLAFGLLVCLSANALASDGGTHAPSPLDGGAPIERSQQTPLAIDGGTRTTTTVSAPPTTEELLRIVRKRPLLERLDVLRLLELLRVFPQLELDLF